MHDTLPYLEKTDFPPISRESLEILQVNLGYLCNLSCTHCHVNAGPTRTELMNKEMIDKVLDFINSHNIHTLDLTGGAPEMNPQFKYLVSAAKDKGVKVIDRCNLTILLEPGYQDLPVFLAENQVEIVASLPCYMEDNVDKQRGKGTFNTSILALKALNQLGYGQTELNEGVSAKEASFQYGAGITASMNDSVEFFVDYRRLFDDTGFDTLSSNQDIAVNSWSLGVNYNF